MKNAHCIAVNDRLQIGFECTGNRKSQTTSSTSSAIAFCMLSLVHYENIEQNLDACTKN